MYTNVYLFELGISALKSQKNSRELEIIIRECILQTIRDNIPVEELLKLYMSETVEDAMEVHERAVSASQLNGVSFNMKNNEVIPIENISGNNSANILDDDNDESEYSDFMNDDNNDNDEDDDNVKLSIGENVELSVDPFPVDDMDDGNDSDVDIKIDSIPPLDL